MKSASLSLPSTMQVFERGWLSSNNVLFTGRAPALVDSGYVSHAGQTVALVRQALAGQRLARLITTHLHSDHCGGHAALQQEFDCHTFIPAAEAAHVAAWDEDALSFRATGQQCARFHYHGTLEPGATLELGEITWQVLAAPGHHAHAVILYSPEERILISADALWENGFGVIFPELAGEPGFAETRATLELIAQLDIRLVIPGHGPMFAHVGAALDRAFSRIEYLAADPRRNAENGIKVLVKFLLLERQTLPLSEVPQLLAAIPAIALANERYLQKTPQALAEWVVAQLLRAKAATIQGSALINHES